MTSSTWLGLVGLGAFHGVNPAMGWLFAVALGLHRQSRAVVLGALFPIAIGHAAAVAVVAAGAWALGAGLDARAVRIICGLGLVGWAVYHRLYGSRHRVRFGMRVGMLGLAVWSFLMAAGHGAGLMLLPFLLPSKSGGAPAAHAAHVEAGVSLAASAAAIAVHSLAMLAVTGLVAMVVYEWVGVAFLRRGWINLDLPWTLALLVTGTLLLLTA